MFRRGWEGHTESPPPRPRALFLWLSPDEMNLCFDAGTDLCILITIETSELMPEKYLHCFPEDGNLPIVEWSFWH